MKIELYCSGDVNDWKEIAEDVQHDLAVDLEFHDWSAIDNGTASGLALAILDGDFDLKTKVKVENLGLGYIVCSSKKEDLEIFGSNKSLLGVIDKSWDEGVRQSQFKSVINSILASTLEAELDSISKELGEIIGGALTDYQSIKVLHEKYVPLRTEVVKGITYSSKYAAGERAGGEFFDIIKGDSESLVILSSTSTYVGSSLVLSHFEKLRNENDPSDENIKRFLMGLSNEAESLGIGRGTKEHPIQLMLLKTNFKNLECEGYTFGNCKILSSGKTTIFGNNFPLSMSFLDKAQFKFTLGRGENLCILSPGFLKNASKFITDSFEDTNKVKELLEKDAYKFLNELFYQIKKDLKKDFLDFDASAMHIKVDQNVLVQV